MSVDTPVDNAPPVAALDTPTSGAGERKRPRLDLNVNQRERKRGKTMFGLVIGTLNKAKNEDKARSASEAVCCLPSSGHPLADAFQAKKRQEIEERLQHKLKKETDSVRKAEEIKKDKVTANRKEEELQLKDSIVRVVFISFLLFASPLLAAQASSLTTSSSF